MSIQRGDSRRFLSRQAGSGFTLVELLVVVAVLAVLTGILIPTVQYTRESARLRQCQNNLRQIGLAALAYESSQRQLPAGTLGYPNAVDWNDFRNQPAGTNWRKVPHSSFWIPLLPYLEQQSLSSDIHPALRRGGESLVGAVNRSGETITWFGEADGFKELSTSSIGVFHCPSDSLINRPVEVKMGGGSQPVTTDGRNDRFDFLSDVRPDIPGALVAANYLGCAGAHSGGIPADPNRLPFRGAMSSGEPLKLNKILDGTSNTFLAGETIGRWRRGVRQRVQLWTVGGLARIRGDVPWMSDLDHLVDPTKIMLGTPLEAAEVGFGAMHPGQVAFVMVDGSTTAISRETDWKLLYRMAGIASSKSDF